MSFEDEHERHLNPQRAMPYFAAGRAQRTSIVVIGAAHG